MPDAPELDHETLWRAMRKLTERLEQAFEGQTVIDDALDIVVELLRADRGVVFLGTGGGAAHVVHARGTKGVLNAFEREEVSRTLVRRALDTGECVVWNLGSQSATASIGTLGIYGAIAAPLADVGVLYVDFRDMRKVIGPNPVTGPRQIEFFMSAVVLFTAMLAAHRRGETARSELALAKSHATEVTRIPSLETLLAPRSMASIRDELRASLMGNSPIFILGESGTGKTLLAQAVAEASGRRPIVRATLGGSDDLNTITSELFGHEKGSFSGAVSKRIGLVEFAKGGTLILDEVLNLPPHAQKLLLDFTQFGTYRPLGYDKPEPKTSDVRIIAATNGDLDAAMRDGRFREDLFYRLAAVTLHMPPLRERREDLPPFAEQTLRRVDPGRAWSLSIPLRQWLVSDAFDWPGNVRQFERVVERARERALAKQSTANVLELEHFDTREVHRPSGATRISAPAPATAPTWQDLQNQRVALEELEQRLIREALDRHGGVIAHAAKELGIARTTLASRVAALGITRG